MECGLVEESSGAEPASWPPPSADHDTRHAAVQRNSGIGAAETEESVTLGEIRKRKGWDSQWSFTPDNITLGAMSPSVKRYNVSVDRSTIQACCDARWNGQGA